MCNLGLCPVSFWVSLYEGDSTTFLGNLFTHTVKFLVMFICPHCSLWRTPHWSGLIFPKGLYFMEKMHAGTQKKEEGDAERSCSELTRTPVPHLLTPLGPGTEGGRRIRNKGVKVSL